MPKRERVVYINGEIVPESQGHVSFRDKSFIMGDGAFDTERTFNGVVFKLREHLDRFFNSLRYLRLDPGLTKEEFESITQEVVKRNVPLLGPNEDYWVTQRVTRGVPPEPGQKQRHTVVVECTPLPLAQRARFYRDGLPVIIPSVRRTPPWAFSPQAKTHNYLNVILADLEVRAQDPDAWAILLDENGNLAEGMGSNIFIVRDGALFTPKVRWVLPGVSRQTVMELARGLDIPVQEEDIGPFEAYTADECFITATSICIMPVKSVNGQVIGDGRIPGPMTSRLLQAYSDLVGLDIVGQYLAHLEK